MLFERVTRAEAALGTYVREKLATQSRWLTVKEEADPSKDPPPRW